MLLVRAVCVQRVSRCEHRYLCCSCLCQERGFIHKSSVLHCPAVGCALCTTAVSHCCPQQRKQGTVHGGSRTLHTVPPPRGTVCLRVPWRGAAQGRGEWGQAGGVCVAGDVAGGSGVCGSARQRPVPAWGWCQSSRGALLSLENALSPRPGEGLWAVKVTPKLSRVSPEVLCHWLVSVPMDPSGKGLSAGSLFLAAEHS